MVLTSIWNVFWYCSYVYEDEIEERCFFLFCSVVEEKFVGIVTLCVGVLHDVTRIPVDDDPLLQLE